MSFFSTIREFVKAGLISQQSAYLAQLIEAGVSSKEELAVEIGKTVRAVELQLKPLFENGLIHRLGDMLIVPKEFSLDQTLKTSIYLNNIDTDEENFGAIETASKMLKCSAKRIRQAIKNAGVEVDDNKIIQAAQITLQRKPRSLVGYFVRVLQNMDIAIQEPKEEVSTWQEICNQIKDKVAKCSFEFFFKRVKCVKKADKLYITGQNVREMWQVYGDLLSKYKIHGYLAGDTRQFAI
jgi:hypothetical protein